MNRVETVLHLEPCSSCKGKGFLGRAGIHVITCERCGGFRLRWVERCALVKESE